MPDHSTSKKLKVEESKNSIDDELSEGDEESSSDELSDMSSGRVKNVMWQNKS